MRPARPSGTPGAVRGWAPQWRWVKPNGREPAVVAGISPAEESALRELARGAAVLEIGSAWGYSTIIMASVARSLVSVDPHRDLDSLETFLANLRAHGVAARVQSLVTTSREALPHLLSTGRRFDLIFVDGDHAPEAVAFDAMWARHLITAEGVIAFHDYHAEKGDPIKAGLYGWPDPDELVERLAVYRGRGPA